MWGQKLHSLSVIFSKVHEIQYYIHIFIYYLYCIYIWPVILFLVSCSELFCDCLPDVSCWRSARPLQISRLSSELSSRWEAFPRSRQLQCHRSNMRASRGRHYKRYSVIATTLCYVFALLHNALYLWRIVITVEFSQALSLMIVIALSLQVSVIASLCYRFE